MNSFADTHSSFAAGRAFGVRRARGYAMRTLALLGALVGYCELCSVVNGISPPGLAISVPWAIRVALGWIVVATVLGAFGHRVVEARFASTHPRLSILLAVLAAASFAATCETLLWLLWAEHASVAAFLYERAPVNLAVSAILIALYLGERLWKQRSSQSDIAGPAKPGAPPVEAELIEVMTGTGRVSIHVADIECLQADRNYISVMHVSGRAYLLRQTMATTAATLDPSRFVRIHRSTIVNRHRIKERRAGAVLVLESGRTVRVGRAFRDRLSRVD